jgi:hypothetical protein
VPSLDQYIIYRRGEPQTGPDEERNAAIAELRRMGVEIRSATSEGALQQAVVRNWRSTVGNQAEIVMPKLLSLMSTARGIRENVQVLAKSDAKKRKKGGSLNLAICSAYNQTDSATKSMCRSCALTRIGWPFGTCEHNGVGLSP